MTYAFLANCQRLKVHSVRAWRACLYHGPFKWRAVLLLIFLGFAKVCTQVLDIGFLFYPNIFSFQKLKIFVSQNASIMINDTSIIICVSVVRALLA